MDKFDMELKEMAKKSEVKASNELREKVNKTCRRARIKYMFKSVSKVAVIFIACIFTLGFSIPAFADQVPIVRNVIEYLNEKFDRHGYENVVEGVRKSIKAGDYSINIEDVYYDDLEMTLFYTVTSDKPLDKAKKYWFDADMKMNVDCGYEYSIEEGSLIDENTFAGMMTFNFIQNHKESNEIKMPDKLDVDLNISDLFIGFGDKKKEIPVKKNILKLSLDNKANSIKEYKVNKVIENDGDKIEILKVKRYPARILVENRMSIDKKDKKLDFIVWDAKKELKYIAGFENKEENSYLNQYIMPESDEIYIVPILRDRNNIEVLKDKIIKVNLK